MKIIGGLAYIYILFEYLRMKHKYEHWSVKAIIALVAIAVIITAVTVRRGV